MDHGNFIFSSLRFDFFNWNFIFPASRFEVYFADGTFIFSGR